MKSVSVHVAAALLLGCAAGGSAQSLADVARQEEARRKAIKSSGKVYTNDTLSSEPQPANGAQSAPLQAQPAQTPAGAPTSPPPTVPANAAALKPEDNPKMEAYWRKRLTTEREALARAESFALALQSRINALSTDFVNRDDPAQRNVIAGDREKALAEQARVAQEIQQHQKAIAGIQDEGRRAGVPAGWLR